MTAPRPAAEAALTAQARRRRRAARHATVLGTGLSLLAVTGVVSAGAAVGRWDLPFVDEPERAVATEDPAEAGPQAPVCGPDGAAEVAAPAGTDVEVRNGTSREGLAGTTADALVERGFTVSDVGNTPLAVGGATQVRFPPDMQAQGLAVAAHSGAADVMSDTGTDSVILTLGPDFAAVRPIEEVDALLAGAGEIFPGCLAVPAAAPASPPASPAPVG